MPSVERASHCTVQKNITPFARFEFITTELFKIQVLRDVMPLNDSSYHVPKTMVP